MIRVTLSRWLSQLEIQRKIIIHNRVRGLMLKLNKIRTLIKEGRYRTPKSRRLLMKRKRERATKKER
jgi:hypothetical protein